MGNAIPTRWGAPVPPSTVVESMKLRDRPGNHSSDGRTRDSMYMQRSIPCASFVPLPTSVNSSGILLDSNQSTHDCRPIDGNPSLLWNRRCRRARVGQARGCGPRAVVAAMRCWYQRVSKTETTAKSTVEKGLTLKVNGKLMCMVTRRTRTTERCELRTNPTTFSSSTRDKGARAIMSVYIHTFKTHRAQVLQQRLGRICYQIINAASQL
jgi:hypothetical protein